MFWTGRAVLAIALRNKCQAVATNEIGGSLSVPREPQNDASRELTRPQKLHSQSLDSVRSRRGRARGERRSFTQHQARAPLRVILMAKRTPSSFALRTAPGRSVAAQGDARHVAWHGSDLRVLACALGLLGLVACGSGASAAAGGAQGVGTGGSLSGAGGTVSGGGGATGGGAGLTCDAPIDLGVHYVGRVDGCTANGARYAWPGTGFVGRFNGTGLSVELTDTGNEHTVLIDGKLGPPLITTGAATYPLASGLAVGEHTFEVYRRTESSFGITLVQGFEVEGGELLAPPTPPARHVEIVGDSISCGYGDEGSAPCTFSAATENNYVAYGSVLARSLDAEVSTVAVSGKGIIYNYNGDKLLPMPTLYDATYADDRKHAWGFAWQADIVIVNLGTNDFSTASDPTDELFISTYTTFLEHLRSVYPGAFILCTVGPMLSGTDLTKARTDIAAAVDARKAAGDQRVKAYEMTTPNTGPACDYHPSIATHAAMAAELETEVRADLGW